MPGMESEEKVPGAMKITFRPLEQADIPLLHAWLNSGSVLKWFGQKPTSLEDVEVKYTRYINGEKPTKAFIIQADATGIGYIQTYFVCDYPEYNAHVQADEHTAGVDLFIGHHEFIHKGYGVLILREFLKTHVFSNPRVDRCVIGPEPKNRAAIRMYEKAGFRWYKTVQLPDAEEPEYLMVLEKEEYRYD